MRIRFVLLLALTLCAAPLDAQRRGGRVRSLRDDPAVLAAFAEVVAAVDPFVVVVRVDGERVALGAVVDAGGSIVTKASELGAVEPRAGDSKPGDSKPGGLTVLFADGATHSARLVGVDALDDLALLKVDGVEGLKAVVWAAREPLVGAWFVTPDGDGTPAGIGVLSSTPYNHSVDRGYLGVQLHQDSSPVRLMAVHEDTAAAAAGLEPEDVILAVDGAEVGAAGDLVRGVQAKKPGDAIVLKVRRGDDELELTATLRRDRRGSRSDQEPLWGPLSEVRAGFGTVLQHDTILTPESCGGPLVDLDGRVVGVNIARAGRIESLALPADEVRAAVARIRAAAKAATPPASPRGAATATTARKRAGHRG